MRDDHAAELRRLLPELLDLLAKIAGGEIPAHEAAGEYSRLHLEARGLLTQYGEECVCPWPNAFAWYGAALKLPAWRRTLVQRAKRARILCGLEVPPPWTLVDYQRNGDPNDVPFWQEFVDGLPQHKQQILMEALDRELAYRGLELISDWTKLHTMPCSSRRGATTRIYMYKIKHGDGQGQVALRVFFVTASAFRLVLLHGYDKGADDDEARENREAETACERRSELLARAPERES